MRKFLAVLIIIVATLSTKVIAQMTSDIDTIYVMASKIPMKATNTGRNITVISQKMIQQTYATSLDDLLQYLPGIEVQSRNAFGAQGDITMRGATFTQVLVLIDGMKLNDPLTSHFNSNLPVSPSEIDRIEILRGASAVIFGADAIGGVINIITKGVNSENRTEVQGEMNLGQNKLVSAQQGFSISKNNSYIGGGFSMNQSDGAYIAPQIVNGKALEEYNNFFDIKSFGLSYGHRWENGWKMKLRSAYDDRHFSARYFYTTSTFDKSVETTRNWWNQVQISKGGTKSSTDFNLAYKYNTDQFIFSPDFPSTNNHISKLFNFNVGHLRNLSEDITLRVGAQFDKRSIRSNDRGDHNDVHVGLYAMSNLHLLDKLNSTISLRMDYDENYDIEVSPQLNLSYNYNKITLRGSIGRSIRAADYTERYVSTQLNNLTPGRSLGNPDLVAEKSWSEELGIDLNISSSWSLKSTLFIRHASNLIDYISTPESRIPNNQGLQSGGSYFYARNITDVVTKGLELESLIQYPLTKTSTISWIFGYTHLNTTNEDNVISVYISSHAKHLVTNLIRYTSPIFNLSMTNLYKARGARIATAIDASISENYSLWNTRLQFHLTDQVSSQIQIHNMFDVTYSDILGAPMPQRWISGGIAIKL